MADKRYLPRAAHWAFAVTLWAVCAVLSGSVEPNCKGTDGQSGGQSGADDAACPRSSSQPVKRDHVLLQASFGNEHSAGKPKLSTLEETTNNIYPEDYVYLTAKQTGKRIAVNGELVDATGSHPAAWARLQIERHGEYFGPIVSDEWDLSFRAHATGMSFSVDDANEVVAKWDNVYNWANALWENLQIKRKDGPGPVSSGDAICLLSKKNSNYIGVDGTRTFNEVVAKFGNCGAWEELIIEKAPDPTTTQMPTTEKPAKGVMGSWHVEPGACDRDFECYRLRDVTCQGPKGEMLPASQCPGPRPLSFEPCHKLGSTATCVNIAASDCIDVPGCWWNKEGMTCRELRDAGKCADHKAVCPESCGVCHSLHIAMVAPGTERCEENVCEDDPSFEPPSPSNPHGITPYNSCKAVRAAGQPCDSYAHAEDLKAACPKTCGMC